MGKKYLCRKDSDWTPPGSTHTWSAKKGQVLDDETDLQVDGQPLPQMVVDRLFKVRALVPLDEITGPAFKPAAVKAAEPLPPPPNTHPGKKRVTKRTANPGPERAEAKPAAKPAAEGKAAGDTPAADKPAATSKEAQAEFWAAMDAKDDDDTPEPEAAPAAKPQG